METMPIYWPGNAAKTRVIQELLAIAGSRPGSQVVFDFGCGDGAGWVAILRDHPGLTLRGYDPSPERIARARKRFEGLPAELHTGDAPPAGIADVDFVVSFSVFEHVRDRRAYLSYARSILAPTGTFFLNYDDGHFRRRYGVRSPRIAWSELRGWLNEQLLERRADRGQLAGYKRRVPRDEADGLVRDAGFDVLRDYYSNLLSMKEIVKSLPYEDAARFTGWWVDIERVLNETYRRDGEPLFGDTVNLWRGMVSRTLVLRPADGQ